MNRKRSRPSWDVPPEDAPHWDTALSDDALDEEVLSPGQMLVNEILELNWKPSLPQKTLVSYVTMRPLLA